MSSLLAQVAERLEAERIPFAIIGATAMAARGVSRATQDVDVLVTHPRSLTDDTWSALRSDAIRVEVRQGDDDDPLLGVVRIKADPDAVVDVVVGRGDWQTELIRRASPVEIDGVEVPVATADDLVLLKLYAGGLQDRWDIAQLVAAGGQELRAAVRARLHLLPASCTALWESVEGAGE